MSKSWRQRTAALALELVIVFVGVYAAFLLQEHGERRRLETRRRQVYAALIDELTLVSRNSRNAEAYAKKLGLLYERQLQDGQLPKLIPLTDPVGWTPHMWQATLQSGGLELLDVPTLYRISSLYNDVELAFEYLRQLRELSEDVVVPNLGRDGTEFFDPETRKVRPKYEWYFRALKGLERAGGEVGAEADRLIPELRARMRR